MDNTQVLINMCTNDIFKFKMVTNRYTTNTIKVALSLICRRVFLNDERWVISLILRVQTIFCARPNVPQTSLDLYVLCA
jgi:hypothetical protein